MAQRWQPDTCECSVVYDGAVFATEGLIAYERKCAIHDGLGDAEAWDAIRVENVTRCRTMAALMALAPETFTKTDEKGNVQPTEALFAAITFDARRKVLVEANLSPKLQADLEAMLIADPLVDTASVVVLAEKL